MLACPDSLSRRASQIEERLPRLWTHANIPLNATVVELVDAHTETGKGLAGIDPIRTRLSEDEYSPLVVADLVVDASHGVAILRSS